jgi:hypothetical protein
MLNSFKLWIHDWWWSAPRHWDDLLMEERGEIVEQFGTYDALFVWEWSRNRLGLWRKVLWVL